jgi:hypothetical protein
VAIALEADICVLHNGGMRLDRPEVTARHRGVRPVFLLTLALSLSLAVLAATRSRPAEPERGRPAIAYGSRPHDWLAANRAHCNAVEVTTFLATHNPGSDVRGAGQRAACLALAGKIDAARRVIAALAPGDRDPVVNQVFFVGHPVADAGDDASARPIMELVIEFQPDQFMALYHAGMAAAVAGDDDLARGHLIRFLAIYRARDGWSQNANAALAALDRPRPQRVVKQGGEGSLVY